MNSRKKFRELRVNDKVCQGQEDVFTVRKMSKNTGNKAKVCTVSKAKNLKKRSKG